MTLVRPPLLQSRREWAVFAGAMLLIAAVRLGMTWHEYRAFVSAPMLYRHTTLVAHYPKIRHGRSVTIAKVRTASGRHYYTTLYRTDLHRGDRLYLQLLPTPRIGWIAYLRGPYLSSRLKRVDPPRPTLVSRLERFVARQHTDGQMAAIYNALFWATPLPREVRDAFARLGISHLVALSGMHLGMMWLVLFGIMRWAYRWAQQRWFPGRYDRFDVGGAVLIVLAGYVALVGAPASLVRAYAMVLLGWVLMLMGVEVIGFGFLAAVVLVLLALAPVLLFSLGFWLSVAGVFYIFLLLQQCRDRPAYLVGIVCIPIGIFFLMQPLVHGWFGVTTPWQLLSPLLSVGFVLFYPLAVILHLVGAGGWLDGALQGLLSLSDAGRELIVPPEGVIVYVALSIAAAKWRWGGYALWGVALALAVYGLWG